MCVLIANDHIHTNLPLEVQEAKCYRNAMKQRKEEKEEQNQNRRISQAAYHQCK